MEYNYFTSKKQRNDIKNIGDNLADYVHDNNIENILFVDPNARMGYYVLRQSWKEKFPDTKFPSIFFTNPHGYITSPYLSSRIIANKFDKTYKSLAKDKNANILLFNTCLYVDGDLGKIVKTMDAAGYTHVKTGCSQPAVSGSKLHMDFEALKIQPQMKCVPFLISGVVSPNDYDMLSSRFNMPVPILDANKLARNFDREMKEEIKSIYLNGPNHGNDKDPTIILNAAFEDYFKDLSTYNIATHNICNN